MGIKRPIPCRLRRRTSGSWAAFYLRRLCRKRIIPDSTRMAWRPDCRGSDFSTFVSSCFGRAAIPGGAEATSTRPKCSSRRQCRSSRPAPCSVLRPGLDKRHFSSGRFLSRGGGVSFARRLEMAALAGRCTDCACSNLDLRPHIQCRPRC